MKSKNTWLVIVSLLAFIISVIMTFISTITLNNVSLLIAILITFLFIFLGIIFDIIGVSVTCADITQFHSMSSKKMKSGTIGVKLLKNNSKVSSICCDVVGDVCGIVSGSCGVTIISLLLKLTNMNVLVVTLLVPSLISSITIGGKAFGKNIAINKSDKVISLVSKILSLFVFSK